MISKNLEAVAAAHFLLYKKRMQIRHRLLGFLSLVLVALSSPLAADPGAPLWQMKSAHATLYLFGTVHQLPAGLAWQNALINDAFALSDTLVLEIPPNQLAALKILPVMNFAGTYRDGSTLKEHIPLALYERTEAAWARYELPKRHLRRFRPWAVANTIEAAANEGGIATSRGAGVEKVLLKRAKGRDLEFRGLENAEDGIYALANLPEPVQLEMLARVLDDLDNAYPEFDGAITAWAAGDLDPIIALMGEFARRQPELYEAMLVGRNRRWVRPLERLLKTPGTHFVAVGTGHLVRDGRVQQLLRARGHVVTRLQ